MQEPRLKESQGYICNIHICHDHTCHKYICQLQESRIKEDNNSVDISRLRTQLEVVFVPCA